MPPRVEAIVKAALLIWARESSGLTVDAAAKRLKLTATKLASWEAGETRPSIPQLRKMAEVYKRPLAVFFLPEAPSKFEAMKDFRRLQGEHHRAPSAALHLEIRKARQRREVAVELAAEMGAAPLPFAISSDLAASPERTAASIREALGIGLEQQISWRDKYDALNGWKSAVEAQAVLVFQMSGVRVKEARGFSEFHETLPIIVLNGADSPRGRLFTLLHEVAHLALRATGLCDLHEAREFTTADDRVETYCNRVAGFVLVPPTALRDEPLVRSHRGAAWTDSELRDLSERYSVSGEVMLRSLLLAGATSEAFYQQRRQEFLAAYEAEGAKAKGGPIPYFRKALAWNGRPYSRLVLDAYDEERITGPDLVDFLGVKIAQVDRIRSALERAEEASV
jgi:Zn-dependent peptidase ImmA (M78 family)/transcriptional regulator with XRE-family HTH domain